MKETIIGSIQPRLMLLFVLLLFAIPQSLGQFYPVPKMKVEMKVSQIKTKAATVESFSISELITVKEFKEYLSVIKKDSIALFYQSQLPTSRDFSKELLNGILSSEDLQDKPMPGVSWSVARNYCKWLTEKSKIKGTDYQYETQDSDSPAMKRKVIYGGSYHMNYTSFSTYKKYEYEYQDSSSRYVDFRILRRHKEATRSIDSVNNSSLNFGFENNNFNGIYQKKHL